MRSEYFADLSKYDRRLQGSGIVQKYSSLQEFEGGVKAAPMKALTNAGNLTIIIKEKDSDE